MESDDKIEQIVKKGMDVSNHIKCVQAFSISEHFQ